MEAAREELGAIRPGTEVDQELMEAVDEGIARIEEYRDQILEKHPEYTEEEKQLIKTAAAAAVKKSSMRLPWRKLRLRCVWEKKKWIALFWILQNRDRWSS